MFRGNKIAKRTIYEVVEPNSSGHDVYYVGIEDTMQDGKTVNFYMIPYSEFKEEGKRQEFIDHARQGVIEFPPLHSHTAFDLRFRGLARFSRSLEETKGMIKRSTPQGGVSAGKAEEEFGRRLSDEKRLHGRSDKTGEFSAILNAAKSLRSDVSRASEFKSSYMNELKTLQEEARNTRLPREQREELQGIYQYIQKLSKRGVCTKEQG